MSYDADEKTVIVPFITLMFLSGEEAFADGRIDEEAADEHARRTYSLLTQPRKRKLNPPPKPSKNNLRKTSRDIRIMPVDVDPEDLVTSIHLELKNHG